MSALEKQLAFARRIVELSHEFELTADEEVRVLIGYAVGVLLAKGRTTADVTAVTMKAVDSSLIEAMTGGLVRPQ
jgi:hypothetical protein